MKVITSGSAYLDIDAYAGCIAYAALLRLFGEPAQAVSSAPLNESITRELRRHDIGTTSHIAHAEDTFVLVDVSDPSHLDPLVDIDRVVEVIDHHHGYEDFWHARLGERACIEHIGAAATQIHERWRNAGMMEQMDPAVARLLLAAIVDNTLNFQARVTTERDRRACIELLAIAKVGSDWVARYFSDCQTAIEDKLESAVLSDAKRMVPGPNRPAVLGQLVVWDAQRILATKRNVIGAAMQSIGDDWAINIVSISEGRSYFLSGSRQSQEKLSRLLDRDVSNGVLAYDRLILRKELLRLPAFAENAQAPDAMQT
jgi:inorganic pyrophosphatase